MRSRGALEFARVADEQAAIARRLGVRQSAIAMWRSGARVPLPAHRKKIARLYAVDASAWDEPIAKKARAERPAIAGVGPADRLEAAALELEEQLRKSDDSTPLERAKVLRMLAGTRSEIGKLRDEEEITEARILATPAWGRVLDRIVGALRPFPEALKALEETLRAAALP